MEASMGEEIWARLIKAGAPFHLRPYGIEALDALRVEKGHVAELEINGRTKLDDLGLSRMAGKRRGYVVMCLAAAKPSVGRRARGWSGLPGMPLKKAPRSSHLVR
ncbi:hypothetical protein [Mesorhizobium sp. M0601]|uniref:hypothetical protein n=1 Tax=Mesorhizobium sp. M0601 TaxID=2956969 RepID=UPI00333737A6